MKMSPNKQRVLDDLLMLLMLCISGNPAFTQTEPFGKFIYGISLIVFLVVSGFKVKLSAIKDASIWIVFTSIIFAVQYFQFGYITIMGSINLIVKILCAIFLSSYLGERLPHTAIRIMAGICAVSLIFYAINLTGIRFHSPIKILTKGETLIIYTQTWEDRFAGDIFRNSGCFWEPGAFSGYIMAVMMLFVDNVNLLFTKYKWHFGILVLALLSTTSTTGYITFAILMLYYIFRWGVKRRNRIYAYLIAILVIAGSAYAFTHFKFLGDKMRKEMMATENQKESDINFSRMGSIIFDMQYIQSHPLFGNGLAGVTRFRYHLGTYEEEELSGFGNGFSGCIASMGILFMLAYLVAIGANRTLRSRWIVILLIILLLQGEYFLNYPFFFLFPFIKFGPPIQKTEPKYRIKIKWNKKTPSESPS